MGGKDTLRMTCYRLLGGAVSMVGFCLARLEYTASRDQR